MKTKTRALVYPVLLFFITLTGFAQMPIFKRYYIADVPGLGWLDQFYVTHSMHYILASLLIGLAAFGVTRFILGRKGLGTVTRLGAVKVVLMAGLFISGGLMVVRNLPGVFFSPVAIHVMNLAHLGCCMALLMVSLAGRLFGKAQWIRD